MEQTMFTQDAVRDSIALVVLALFFATIMLWLAILS